MTDEELIELRNRTAKRLAEYANSTEYSALAFLRVMRSSFSTEGAMLYNISDKLSDWGY